MTLCRVVEPILRAAARGRDAVRKVTISLQSHDELTFTNGEGLQLVRRINSEWVLCVNERGEPGIVPLNRIARGGAAHE
jgi:hypothetical protein